MKSRNLYHEGELAVQRHAGEIQMARMNAGALSDRIPAGAMRFIEQQPMAIVGSIDRQGQVWASVLLGTPGFLHADDDRTLVLEQSRTSSAADDPLWDNLEANPQVGLLVIELESRRRLRVNGCIRRSADNRFVIHVERAYPNCPKYIQRRHWKIPKARSSTRPASSRCGADLGTEEQAWISGADTFFVASAHPAQGVDASHRGGRPGFVQVLDPSRLRIPDFSGNGMFNTLGNFVSYPHAGLAFFDFERGRVLRLSGRPKVLWDRDDPRGETGGTCRYWEFNIDAWQESELPFGIEWEFLDYSPFIPAPRGAEAAASSTLQLQIEQVRRETERIKRFRLSRTDGAALPAFEPGAHLPVSVRLTSGEWAIRNYSILSDPANRAHYEIAVLAEPAGGGGSLYLHQRVHTGDKLETLPPKNAFPMAASADHSILIAGGIGITPLFCMARALKASGRSFELHYGVQRWPDLAFRDTIVDLAGNRSHFYASREPRGSRIDLARLLAKPAANTHVYVCGPYRMIENVREHAAANSWPMDRIHFESFGASRPAEDRELTVKLARSGLTLSVPASRSILDMLLDAGLAVPHDCKRGECSMCVAKVLDGAPLHRDLCLTPAERSDSMCICVSRAKSDRLTLDL